MTSSFAGWGTVGAEVFLAAVAEPDAEDLGDPFSLVGGEALVEGESAVPFAAAGLVFVGVPMTPGQADSSAGFLDELRAGEIGVVLFVLLDGHRMSRDEYLGYRGSSAGAHRHGIAERARRAGVERVLQSIDLGKAAKKPSTPEVHPRDTA